MKLIKGAQFRAYALSFVDKFKIGVTSARILKLFVFSFFVTHLFSCLFYLSARMYDFADNTWVTQRGIIDYEPSMAWCQAMYWACQTLTTVGYGDFGAHNNWEIAITCLWMFCGVAIYTVVIGTLTSMVESTQIGDIQKVLIS